jgi:hypothetical protein
MRTYYVGSPRYRPRGRVINASAVADDLTLSPTDEAIQHRVQNNLHMRALLMSKFTVTMLLQVVSP